MSTHSTGKMPSLPAGSVIGILGGGQLGRMIAQSAARLGYKCHIYSDVSDAPAAQVSWKETVADYFDKKALKNFATNTDVITLEFENIPVRAIKMLEEYGGVVFPSASVFSISQARDLEKTFLNNSGIATAKWYKPTSHEDTGDISFPAILKANRLGYDGKGQVRVENARDLSAAFQKIGTEDAILEEVVDFSVELSVIVARSRDGQTRAYPPSINFHENHILVRSIAPAPIDMELLNKARVLAQDIARKINLVGIMGVEMFLTNDEQLLVNELAPRPHNSGHWTMDGCLCSQFEQHIRAIAGLPLGSAEQHSPVEMINLIGDDALKAFDYLSDDQACLYLYGKDEIRSGRKMGHVNIVKPNNVKAL